MEIAVIGLTHSHVGWVFDSNNKGNIEIISRESANSLYDENTVTFEDDKNSYQIPIEKSKEILLNEKK